jgi:hypothetical protein
MPWGVVVGAVISAHTAGTDTQPRARMETRRESDMSQLVREHQARMAEMHTETVRSAKIGMFLLLALAASAIYCVAQFFI